MPFILLAAGLVLLFAGKSWFVGAATVGLILTILGAIPFVWFVIVAILGLVGIRHVSRH